MQKFSAFMQGRYGMDNFNKFIFIVFLVLWFVNLFVFNSTASLIIDLFELIALALFLFRTLSRNIYGRSAENRRFTAIFNSVTNWFKLCARRFKERNDYKYLKCPSCKAQLRVKRKKGTHTVRCPRCGKEFEKKIF